MPKQSTIVLVYRDEIEQFAMLMNQGLPLDTLIRLTFKKDEEIITYLKEGMNLQEIFTLNQKKLYFVEEVFLLFFSYQITQNRKT